MMLRHKLISALKKFTGLFAAWSFLLLLMRIAEWMINGTMHGFPGSDFFIPALLSDFLFISTAGLCLCLLFLAAAVFSLKAAKLVFIVLTILLTAGYFALQKYFNSTLVLLGADLFGYSTKDIQQTVGASGGLDIIGISLLVIIVVSLVFLLRLAENKITPGAKTSLAIPVVLLSGIMARPVVAGWNTNTMGEYGNNLAQNKLDYFLRAAYDHLLPAINETDIYSDSYSGDYGDDRTTAIAGFTFVDEANYPFLHQENTGDVLSPFFKVTAEPPNIVIIVIEGLGRAFSGSDAYLGSFTPFIDSLSQHSLYWPNCLSGSGRTFAVLPTLLGSLPFAKNGFSDLEDGMPANLSLVNLLKARGYSTNFHYGGDASFDNMELFLRKQGIDEVFDKKRFPAAYQTLPSNNGFTWGYGDKELYHRFLAREQTTPSLDLLLTVTTHSPFLVNDAAKFEKIFDDRLNHFKLNERQAGDVRRYRQQLATVLYADDALRIFFDAYSRRPEFNNTIFLVTGDHRMPEIPMSSKIDRYHVPLLIYSPLLTRSARFNAVSSHFDVTPSLLSYLSKRYALQMPSLVTWLGSGLDTARVFRNIHAQALMQTKTDIVDFIKGEYHLNGTQLYRVNSNMQEEPVTDENRKKTMRSELEGFLGKNRMVNDKKLVPDSLMVKYTNKK